MTVLRRAGRRMALALLAFVVLTGVGGSGHVRGAAPYALRTEAVYRIDPAAGAVTVTVSAAFTNMTPDPAGSFSTYSAVPFSLQAGAVGVAARDGSGPLRVTLARDASRTVATVQLRAPLRFGASAAFSLTYRLTDGASPQLRVRASSVMVPIWGFGTASTVLVRMPKAYQARVIGRPLKATSTGDELVLRSAAIRDPPQWSAILVASAPTNSVTVGRRVPLAGGTVDLRVRAFADDRAWGVRMLDLIARALPSLQQAIGLPYAGVGPLLITEAAPSGIGPLAEPATGAQEIAVAFDASPFTVLHQLGHIWMGSAFASERWIREGLASHVAGRVARQLRIAVPYDAAAQAAARNAARVPLATWSPAGDAGPAKPATDTWAYAASWAFVDRLAASVGEENLVVALRRIANDVPAYGAASQPASSLGGPGEPLDSRRLLDQLEEVSGKDLGAAFREVVFPEGSDSLLDVRARARSAYASLVTAAGGWGPPEPIRSALTEWRFDEAIAAVSRAQRWLHDRDRLLEEVRSADLSTPDRLAVQWRQDGGGDQARAELDAERAVVAAYLSARGRIDEPSLIERLGLLWGSEPRAVLNGAAGLYAGGDLRGAAAAIDRAIAVDASAQGSGVVRLAAGTAGVSVVAFALIVAFRRLRRALPWPARSGAPPGVPPSV